MRKLLLGMTLLLGACSDGGRLGDIAARLGIGGDKNCANAASAEAAAPQKAASDEAAPAAADAKPALAQTPDALPPPTSAEGRRLARVAASAVAAPPAPAETAQAAEAEPAPEVEAPAPVSVPTHHRRKAAPVAVSRKAPASPARSDDNHDHFSESTAPSQYRLPVDAQVLVPRPGQTVLNGPRHEGVPPPNSDPVRVSQN